MLTKEELTILTLAGYIPCTCVGDAHWIYKDAINTLANPKLYVEDLRKILYGK